MKKLYKMVALIFFVVLGISLLAFAYTIPAQSSSKLKGDSIATDPSAFQKSLIDSINKSQPIKERLTYVIDSMESKIKENRALFLAGWEDRIKPKVKIIRDTIRIPVPVFVDTIPKIDYSNLIYNLN